MTVLLMNEAPAALLHNSGPQHSCVLLSRLLRRGVLCTALYPLMGSRQNAIRAVLFNFLFGFVTVLYADIASVCGSLGSLFMTTCICVSTFTMECVSSRKIGKTRVAKLETVNFRLWDREAID